MTVTRWTVDAPFGEFTTENREVAKIYRRRGCRITAETTSE